MNCTVVAHAEGRKPTSARPRRPTLTAMTLSGPFTLRLVQKPEHVPSLATLMSAREKFLQEAIRGSSTNLEYVQAYHLIKYSISRIYSCYTIRFVLFESSMGGGRLILFILQYSRDRTNKCSSYVYVAFVASSELNVSSRRLEEFFKESSEKLRRTIQMNRIFFSNSRRFSERERERGGGRSEKNPARD